MPNVPSTLVDRLTAARAHHTVLPELRPLAQAFGPMVMGVLFPHFSASVRTDAASVRAELEDVATRLATLERAIHSLGSQATASIVDGFLGRLGEVHEVLDADARAILEGDPAARSYDEVVLTYPGFYAIAVFRVAHLLLELGLPLLPRLMTEHAHEKTGIDIHPGATIGRRFCIDHGTGIVVGETTRIGDGVKLYQGVTLGAHTVEKALADRKRHPTIEDEVVIYAGATILGGTTVVGHHSIVAGNAFLTQSVPPNSIVTRKSEVRPREPGAAFESLDWVI
ncbi:MAG: serine O-acetyltransferase EpsC [Myxococcaceae bacterium]